MRVSCIVGCAIVSLSPRIVVGQMHPMSGTSIHGVLGVLVPTGRHRAALRDAFAIGAQGQIGLRPWFALVGGALVAQPGYRAPLNGDVTMIQYDLGVELALRAASPMTHSARRRVAPFIGGGVGGRRYAVREDAATRQSTGAAAYVSAGLELAAGRGGLRLELRDYRSRSDVAPTWRGTQNDVAVLAGIAYHFH